MGSLSFSFGYISVLWVFNLVFKTDPLITVFLKSLTASVSENILINISISLFLQKVV